MYAELREVMPDSRRLRERGSDGTAQQNLQWGLDSFVLFMFWSRNDRPTCELAHANPETDGKTGR
jgi:hypothetical protein